jgi:hypothetical protein
MTLEKPLFWKFSRDGVFSETYVSFIFDIPSTQLREESKVWKASFDQLSTVLLLLQDVELLNKKNLEKAAFVQAVQKCGYSAPKTASQMRDAKGLVYGSAVIGRHNGNPIPYGMHLEKSISSTFELDVSKFTPALNLDGYNGRIIKSWKGPRNVKTDLLSCYRAIKCFDPRTNYWDLMPKHTHMQYICHAMKSLDMESTEKFLTQTLQWSPL